MTAPKDAEAQRDVDESHGAELAPLTDHDFARFQTFIYSASGVYLGASKMILLARRLRERLVATGVRTYEQYFRNTIERHDKEEIERLLDCVTTKKTSFFRDERQFQFLEHTVCPSWRADADRQSVRVWSAGCSTGEEAFSIGMVLLDAFAASTVRAEVSGTDVAVSAVQRASTAMWPIEAASDIPAAKLKRYMLRGVGRREGWVAASPLLREVVSFDVHNLYTDEHSPQGSFDAIFCRNVLIYFDQESKRRVVERLLTRTRRGGYIFVGAAESLYGFGERLKAVIPNVYRVL